MDNIMTMGMFYEYSGWQRPEFIHCATTFEAIVAGLRTSTLRKAEWYSRHAFLKLLALKKGDRILFSDKRLGNKGATFVTVELTHDAYLLNRDLTDAELERLSKVEGWSVRYLKNRGYDKPRNVVNLRYKLVG